MAWVCVYEKVNGPKLRKLSTAIGCSKFEALGYLLFLWLWGLNNADRNGRVLQAELDDIIEIYAGNGKPEQIARAVVDCMIQTGWLDLNGNEIYIHDWNVWQDQIFRDGDRKKAETDKKRRWRAKQKEALPAPLQAQVSLELPGESKPEKPQKPKVEKIKYAEFVSMKESEYETLCSSYGKQATARCIEVLDNYKGAKGKRYKDDYRAILSWVISKVKAESPGIFEDKKGVEDQDDNPFKEYMG